MRASSVVRVPVRKETTVRASLHGPTSGGKPTRLVSQKSSLQQISGHWFLCCRLQTGRQKLHRVLMCRCQASLRAYGCLQSVGVPSRLTGNRRVVTLRLSCRCCSRPYSCTDNKKREKEDRLEWKNWLLITRNNGHVNLISELTLESADRNSHWRMNGKAYIKFIAVFAKLRKTTISFVMYICMYVRMYVRMYVCSVCM